MIVRPLDPAGQPVPTLQSACRVPGEIPPGTRVIAVMAGPRDDVRLGSIGVTTGPRESWAGEHYYPVDWGVHGHLHSWAEAIRPLPPEHEVEAFDWQTVGNPVGVC